MSSSPVVVWLRRDLRIADNPALFRAAETGQPVIPVYIFSPEDEGSWRAGAASNWWLHHSLKHLGRSLSSLGADLVVRHGKPDRELQAICQSTGASLVYWNRRYDQPGIDRDQKTERTLASVGVGVKSFHGSLLFEPSEIQKQTGGPVQSIYPILEEMYGAADPTNSSATHPRAATPPDLHLSRYRLKTSDCSRHFGWDEGVLPGMGCG